ncbi:MAG: hypothetical protein RIS43_977 [Actinomycetota bacterium]|jgi:3-phenylpropionate/trans-cinnamate dioxygenase ferredoxin subunit
MTNWSTLCTTSDVAPGTIKKFDIDGLEIALAHTAEGFFAIEDTCTHAEVSLSEGELSDCAIECWMHGAKFDLRTGEALTPPATVPVKTFPIDIVDLGDVSEVRIKVGE